MVGVAVALEELKNVLGEGTCADCGGDNDPGDDVEEAGGVNARGESVNINVVVSAPGLGVPAPPELVVVDSTAVLGRPAFAFAFTVAVAFAAACLKFDCEADVVIRDLSAGFDDVLLAPDVDVDVDVGVSVEVDAEVDVDAERELEFDAVRRGEGLSPVCAGAGDGDDRETETEGGGLRCDFEAGWTLVDAAPAPGFELEAATVGFALDRAEVAAATFGAEVDVVRSLTTLVVVALTDVDAVRSRAAAVVVDVVRSLGPATDVVRSFAALEAVRSRADAADADAEVAVVVFSRTEAEVVRSLAVLEFEVPVAVAVVAVVRSFTAFDIVRSLVEPGVALLPLTAAEAVVLAYRGRVDFCVGCCCPCVCVWRAC